MGCQCGTNTGALRVANAIVVPGGEVPGDLNLLRALNPNHYEDGLPGNDHFVMKLDHEPDNGISTGIEALINVSQMRELKVIKGLYGNNFGVAVLNVSEIFELVKEEEIKVIQQNDILWEDFSNAHAIITGYQKFPPGKAGRKKIREITHHLVKLARRRFFAPGSNEEMHGE